jgi:hypothetical protein
VSDIAGAAAATHPSNVCMSPSPFRVLQGGSRRRLKRHARKVRVGVVKVKKDTKARVPLELTAGCTSVQDTLHKG